MVSLNVVFAAVLALSVLVCVKADGPFYLPTLPYATSELAPYISEVRLFVETTAASFWALENSRPFVFRSFVADHPRNTLGQTPSHLCFEAERPCPRQAGGHSVARVPYRVTVGGHPYLQQRSSGLESRFLLEVTDTKER